MLQNRDVQLTELIKITAGGIAIADYDQVLNAISNRYRQIYGIDIDLANTTADGIFVHDLALIINNILQSFKALYSNLDVDTAAGTYLDVLCRLSNVPRKLATKSTAELEITSETLTTLEKNTLFVDIVGNEWRYSGPSIEIQANDTAKIIQVACTQDGPIQINANSIYQTIENTALIVAQPKAGVVGRADETDASLRARRAQSNGATGVTVLESLVGSLLQLTAIEDVQIVNNNKNVSDTASDGTTIPAHNVYIVLRQIDNIVDANGDYSDDSIRINIGEIIANKLTPGISTTQTTDITNGYDESYTKESEYRIAQLEQNVYWKVAKPIAPTCTVTLSLLEGYSTDAGEQAANLVMNYLNNLQISQTATKTGILVAASVASSKQNGIPTFVATNATVPTGNNNTYYKYTTKAINIVGDVATITLT